MCTFISALLTQSPNNFFIFSWSMETSTNGLRASSFPRLPTCILSPNLKLRSPTTRKISHDLASPTSTHRDSYSRDLQPPNSPTRALKRLVKSVSKNALKLASTFSPRRHHAVSSFSSNSPPPKSSSAEGESSEPMVRELVAVFRYFDADGDGKISWAELKSALNSVEEEVGENELREMIKELDSDGDGCIDEEEFIRLINTQEKGEEKELAAAFRMFEDKQGGGITPLALHRMMCRLGDDALTLHHCNFIISQLDLDGDGVVNFHEFKRMMTAAVH